MEAIAVDVAGGHVVEVRISAAQTGVVHIRGEVVLVDALVAVDVALHLTLRSGNTVNVEFAARTEVADAFVDVEL